MPVPRGKNERPTKDSMTEDFPELCRIQDDKVVR